MLLAVVLETFVIFMFHLWHLIFNDLTNCDLNSSSAKFNPSIVLGGANN